MPFTFSSSARAILVATGNSVDVAAIRVTFTGGDTLTITGVGGTAQLQSITLSYDASINGGVELDCFYPEIGGATTRAGSHFPMLFPYTGGAGATIGAITAITISNTAGIMMIAKTGLTANAAGTFRIQF